MINLVQLFSLLGNLITLNSDDGEDITFGKHSFMGQVNNTSRFICKVSSFVIFYFIHIVAYYSYYGYEYCNVRVLCCLAKVLETRVETSVQTHGVVLPLLSRCLSVLDEICRRSLNVAKTGHAVLASY